MLANLAFYYKLDLTVLRALQHLLALLSSWFNVTLGAHFTHDYACWSTFTHCRCTCPAAPVPLPLQLHKRQVGWQIPAHETPHPFYHSMLQARS